MTLMSALPLILTSALLFFMSPPPFLKQSSFSSFRMKTRFVSPTFAIDDDMYARLVIQQICPPSGVLSYNRGGWGVFVGFRCVVGDRKMPLKQYHTRTVAIGVQVCVRKKPSSFKMLVTFRHKSVVL